MVTVDSRFNEQIEPEKDCSLNRNSLIQNPHVKAFKIFNMKKSKFILNYNFKNNNFR